jgi:hypothetical protein
VRRIVKFDLDHGRGFFWHRNPEHGLVIKFRSGDVLHVVVGHVVGELRGDVLEFIAQADRPSPAQQ